MKQCTKCKKSKPYSAFNKGKNYADGYRTWCKACYSAYRKITHHQYNWRNYRLKNDFGISIELYDTMFKKQEGVCAICKLPPQNKRLAVDHNHQTGKVRGLLCSSCNLGLGQYEAQRKQYETYLMTYDSDCIIT